MIRRPSSDLELWVPRVISALHPVSVLESNGSGGVDQQRPERLIAIVEGLSCQFYAPH